MNFLAFREQIYDWTLDNDQNLFNQVNQLTQYIFQTQKNINESIAITRASLNQSSTILNNNFNHYLRLSENKFTQNKIAQPKKSDDQNTKKQQTVTEPKPKMQIYKQALNISLKNLQIKEEQKQADNISLSQLSLSQAIFKNARLPPYFGSKEFRAQKFLSLFYDEDLGSEILSKKEIQSLSNQPLSTPSQHTGASSNTNNIAAQGYLPPPPSLETLNLGYNTFSGGMNPSLPPPPTLNLPPPPSLTLPPPPSLTLPPPPSLSIPPPPPLSVPQLPSPLSLPPMMPLVAPNRQSMVQIDERDENKDLLLSIMASTKSNNQQTTQNSRDSFISQTQQQAPIIQQPKPMQNRPMTFQQQLALKLKLGKDYKPPAKVIESRPAEPISQMRKQPQSSQQVERAQSFRQSTKIDDIIGSVSGIGQTSKPAPKQASNPIFEDDEQEQSALFSSGKRKTVTPAVNQASQSSKTTAKNEADIMMSRSTFNEDMLFKKKPIFSKESIMPTKTQQKTTEKKQKKPNKASAIFDQDSDEQADFTFKKKITKKAEQTKPKQVVQQKKTNPLMGSSSKIKNEQTEEQPIKKTIPQPKKKTVNKLFGGDSDQQQDIFAKKKTTSKKTIETQSPSKNVPKLQVKIQKTQPQVQKKNLLAAQKPKKSSLFNDDQQEDFSFKPKPKTTKKQSKDDSKQQKKSSLFNDDEDQDFSFKPKAKTSNKQQLQPSQQTVSQVKKVEQPKSIVKKQKNPLFGEIQQEQEDNTFGKKKQRVEKVQKAQQPQQVNEQESQQQAKLRKIARMGGQPMMGIAQMMAASIPKRKQPVSQVEPQIKQEIIEQPISIKEQQKPLVIKKAQVAQVFIKRDLDPLEKIIAQNVNIQSKQQQLAEIVQQPLKPQGVQKRITQIPVQNTQTNSEVTLEVRRKKNKPKKNLDDIFDEEDKKPEKPKVNPPTQTKKTQVKPQVIEQKQKKTNTLFAPSIQLDEGKQSQISKIAKMSMAGMPQMGLGPLIPKGLIITKPSQAKKMQQQALERLKNQQQREIKQKQQLQQKERLRKIHEQQEQKRIEKQQSQQQAQRQRQEQEQRKRLEQEKLLKKQFQEQRQRNRKIYQEQKQRQRQMYNQRQQQRLIEQAKQKERLRVMEQQQRQRKIYQEEERVRNDERMRLQAAQRQKKANLPSLPSFDLTAKSQMNQASQKNKNSNPLDVPKMPPKVNPLGGVSKSSLGGPLGGPLGGNVQKSNGLLAPSIPPIPSIKTPTTQKNTGKKSLFDDDQQDTFQSKKQVNMPKTTMPTMPTINEKKKGTLFDDDDGDSGFGMKSKPKVTKKKGLFDDDDDDQGFGFGKKPQKKVVEPVQEPIRKIASPPKFQQQFKPPTTLPQNPVQKTSNPKKLFGGSDSQEQSGFGKKKVQPVKQAPSIQATTNNFGQKQTKPNLNNQKQTKNKKGLFAGSSDEDEKPVKQTKNVPAKQTKSKKGLFGGSSDSDDDIFKKKNAKKPQPPKQTTLPQSSPLISTQKVENNSTSPLILTKKVQSISANTLPSQSTKLANPLMGSLNGPLSSPNPIKSQHLIENTLSQPKPNPLQQKKRNIFEESEDQSQSSPIIATKQKFQQKPSKKGLISEDSQDQKPIKVVPVKEQEPEPPVTKTNNNRKLFDESEEDSDEQEMMRKKRMANSKLKKLF